MPGAARRTSHGRGRGAAAPPPVRSRRTRRGCTASARRRGPAGLAGRNRSGLPVRPREDVRTAGGPRFRGTGPVERRPPDLARSGRNAERGGSL